MITENKIPATNAATEPATGTVTADVALFAGLSFTVNENHRTCTRAYLGHQKNYCPDTIITAFSLGKLMWFSCQCKLIILPGRVNKFLSCLGKIINLTGKLIIRLALER